MSDTFSVTRKEKRWLVLQKVYVTYNGQIVEPGVANPLQVLVKPATGIFGEAGYSAAVVIAVEGDPWILVEEIASLELAKHRIIEIAQSIGLAKVKLSRAVDLNTVLYPIS